MTTARHTPTAGVRKRPMEEIAGEGTREGAAFAMGIGQPRMRRRAGDEREGSARSQLELNDKSGAFGPRSQHRCVKIDLRIAVLCRMRASMVAAGSDRAARNEHLRRGRRWLSS